MRTVIEKTDIDKENNPIHKFIWGQIAATQVMALLASVSAKKENMESVVNDTTLVNVVGFLNSLDEAGYVIVKKEPALDKL